MGRDWGASLWGGRATQFAPVKKSEARFCQLELTANIFDCTFISLDRHDIWHDLVLSFSLAKSTFAVKRSYDS